MKKEHLAMTIDSRSQPGTVNIYFSRPVKRLGLDVKGTLNLCQALMDAARYAKQHEATDQGNGRRPGSP